MTNLTADIAIIGAGPTGLYAAYYAGFRGWSTVVMDNLPEVGGQITAMYPEKDIYDVAGFVSVRGRQLVEDLKEQADQFAPQYLLGVQATDLVDTDDGIEVRTSEVETTVAAKAVIICGGIGSFKPRPLPAAAQWSGSGLHYFVTDPSAHIGKDIVIVGGGDSAIDWAHMLHPRAKSVSIVHRRDRFRAHGSMVDKAKEIGINFYTPHEVTGLIGDDEITGVAISDKDSGENTELPAQSVIAALGFIANIGPIADWDLDLEKRRIKVATDMSTNRERVFAAGDLAVYPGKVPLLSLAFGEAALAVNNAAPLVDPSLGVFPGHSSGDAA